MNFYITNELPPKKKIKSVQSNPMKHCTEYSGKAKHGGKVSGGIRVQGVLFD